MGVGKRLSTYIHHIAPILILVILLCYLIVSHAMERPSGPSVIIIAIKYTGLSPPYRPPSHLNQIPDCNNNISHRENTIQLWLPTVGDSYRSINLRCSNHHRINSRLCIAVRTHANRYGILGSSVGSSSDERHFNYSCRSYIRGPLMTGKDVLFMRIFPMASSLLELLININTCFITQRPISQWTRLPLFMSFLNFVSAVFFGSRRRRTLSLSS